MNRPPPPHRREAKMLKVRVSLLVDFTILLQITDSDEKCTFNSFTLQRLKFFVPHIQSLQTTCTYSLIVAITVTQQQGSPILDTLLYG